MKNNIEGQLLPDCFRFMTAFMIKCRHDKRSGTYILHYLIHTIFSYNLYNGYIKCLHGTNNKLFCKIITKLYINKYVE